MGISRASTPSVIQIRVLLLILALFFVDGMDTQMVAVALPALIADWATPASRFALALAIGHVGAGLGAPIGGVLGDRIGRKRTIIIGALLFGFVSVFLALITSVNELVVLRFVAGLGLGGCIPPAITLLTERFSTGRRGTVVGLALLCTLIGVAAVGFLAAAVMPLYGWRTLFVIAGLLPIGLAVAMMPLLPESTSFLERISPAAHASAQRHSPGSTVSPPSARASGSWLEIFREMRSLGVAKAASFLCVSFAFTYVAMSFVLTWLPTLLSSEGFSLRVASSALSVWSIAGMAGTFIAGWAVGKIGWLRTTTGLACCAMGGALLLALSAPRPSDGSIAIITLYGLLAITGCMLNGLITALYAAATYVFPTAVRSTGVGTAAMAGRIGAISGALLGVRALKLDGLTGFFLATAAVLLIAALSLRTTGRAHAAEPHHEEG
jgi:AAHS family 4-hydroxybenzoate transporter-like MFS transporter